MTFWTFSSTWGSSWSIWRISHLFAFFKFERKWKLFAKRKKKSYIALGIICVLWTFNLLDSISISNNSTRLLSNNKKKRNVQKQNGLSRNLLYQQGKNSCVIISIIRCLRNYFNHTMFKMTRKLCYKPVCNCDGHQTRRTPVTFLWPYSQMLKFSVPLFGTFLHNQDFMMWELECMFWTLLYQWEKNICWIISIMLCSKCQESCASSLFATMPIIQGLLNTPKS